MSYREAMRQFSFIILAVSILYIAGCDTTTQPLLKGKSYFAGTIFGIVNEMQFNGMRDSDLSGVTISISGTDLFTTTDSTGKWSLDIPNAGIYTITYSKPGYGSYIDMNRQFVGGGSLYLGKINISQPPDFSVSFDTGKCGADSNSLYANGVLSGMHNTGFYRVLLVIGTTPDVTGADPTKYTYAYAYSSVYSNSVRIRLFKTDLQFAGLVSGSQAYMIMYPVGYGLGMNYSAYNDPMTGRMVYTALGKPTEVVPVTIP
jgi:hypothetical protein